MADQAHGTEPVDRATTDAANTGGTGNGPDLTRKQFLTAATVGIGGIMGALIAVPVAGMALSPIWKDDKFEAVLLGKVDEFSEGEFTKVVLAPGTDEPGAYVRKKVAYVRKNKNKGDDKFALQGQEDFSVISNICMHLGCPVQAGTSGFVCPCHGGSYTKDGARQAGPPVRPLDRFLWERRGDELWAVAIYSLTKDGKRTGIQDPGQHTSGPEKWFYPFQPA